jgi:hypothetical protein
MALGPKLECLKELSTIPSTPCWTRYARDATFGFIFQIVMKKEWRRRRNFKLYLECLVCIGLDVLRKFLQNMKYHNFPDMDRKKLNVLCVCLGNCLCDVKFKVVFDSGRILYITSFKTYRVVNF